MIANARFHAHLGNLCGFTRACLSRDDNDLIGSERANNLLSLRDYGERGWIRDSKRFGRWDALLALICRHRLI